jgi:hypothetical protein
MVCTVVCPYLISAQENIRFRSAKLYFRFYITKIQIPRISIKDAAYKLGNTLFADQHDKMQYMVTLCKRPSQAIYFMRQVIKK